MTLSKPFVLLVLLLSSCILSAQDKIDAKFGKISPADFNLSKDVDTSTGAVYITDAGTAEFEDGKDGHMVLAYTYYYRIKVVSKTGMSAADRIIRLWKDHNHNRNVEEKLDKIKGATYNLENGKVVTSNLEESSIYTEMLTKDIEDKKFAMPGVKEGSIIEVMFTVKSDFFTHIRSWDFQGPHPVLWSEYTVRIPDFLHYAFITQGFLPFNINKKDYSSKSFNFFSGKAGFSVITRINITRWAMKNVPALKKENYITSLDNYVSRVQFQLSETTEPYEEHDYRKNWQQINDELLDREEFGLLLDNANSWLNDDIRNIVERTDSKLEKAKKIYAYVRDNFICTSSSEFALEGTLKDVMKNKKGSVADINLLLLIMLRHADISADPILLSTREHGYLYEEFPLMARFNYVIVCANIDNKSYYLDASGQRLGFNHLPSYCYNGYARFIVPENAHAIYLSADSLKEFKMTSAFVTSKDGNTNAWLSTTPGQFTSMQIRDEVLRKGKAEYEKEVLGNFAPGANISGFQIDSLKNFDGPVTMSYNVALDNFQQQQKIVYLNPMMGQDWKQNPLKSAERFYPVEMSYTTDELYTLNMEIPAGYAVEELPQSTRISLNEGEAMFEYLISASNDHIMLKSRIKINRVYFNPSDYKELRGFFEQIVKKHAEMIVFKKISK